jgi:hypothetical protein
MKKGMGCLCQQLPSYHPFAPVVKFIFTSLSMPKNYNQGYAVVYGGQKHGAAVQLMFLH